MLFTISDPQRVTLALRAGILVAKSVLDHYADACAKFLRVEEVEKTEVARYFADSTYRVCFGTVWLADGKAVMQNDRIELGTITLRELSQFGPTEVSIQTAWHGDSDETYHYLLRKSDARERCRLFFEAVARDLVTQFLAEGRQEVWTKRGTIAAREVDRATYGCDTSPSPLRLMELRLREYQPPELEVLADALWSEVRLCVRNALPRDCSPGSQLDSICQQVVQSGLCKMLPGGHPLQIVLRVFQDADPSAMSELNALVREDEACGSNASGTPEAATPESTSGSKSHGPHEHTLEKVALAAYCTKVQCLTSSSAQMEACGICGHTCRRYQSDPQVLEMVEEMRQKWPNHVSDVIERHDLIVEIKRSYGL